MSEHQYDKRISESCVDPNPLMVERQDPDNFTRFQARERCALEITAYVFNTDDSNILLEAQHQVFFSFVCEFILNLNLTILPFGAYITTQSTFGGVRQQWSCESFPLFHLRD